MGCGLEHLSNCHGEITGLFFLLSSGGFWIRWRYQSIKQWIKNKLAKR